MGECRGDRLAQTIEKVAADALERDVPPGVVEVAVAATRRAMGLSGTRSADRAERYFWAVVRRRMVRHAPGANAVARMVLTSVVEDLRASGRRGSEIWDELERGWRGRFPEELFEEYRVRLCA